MKRFLSLLSLLILIFFTTGAVSQPDSIPLPEHPRPDFKRPMWKNMNGWWQFQFDPQNEGLGEEWYLAGNDFSGRIKVPFSWGAPLSEMADEADIGWYRRDIEVPGSWEGKRIYLVIGASDWRTSAWLDGNKLGEHQGGYTEFEFELTPYVDFGNKQNLVIRVDDTPHPFKLEGKQGYGKARGIWQTLYLEARGSNFIDYVHVTPDIREEQIVVEGSLDLPADGALDIEFEVKGDEGVSHAHPFRIKSGTRDFNFTVPVRGERLWTLADPFLYDLEVRLGNSGDLVDEVSTYFGMREIGVTDMPGTDFSYVALNGEPVYLQMALDQAYHPDGYYTFPSDEFMRDEILRTKKIGLNGQRIHVKIGIPRKLYWADKLGVLIMADVPNSWGEPNEKMRQESEYALRQMIKRDYNHPAIFSWVIFNETWGLMTEQEDGDRVYLPETKEWVADMYRLAKDLDPTRLVEDNSANREDHVVTDLNTWHAYLPGYAWDERLAEISEKTYPGSPWNFAEGYRQGDQPNINSECGNVWGYEGSTGDVDWSWDYHRMINAFRKNPKIAGWLYTEHHDVINEWNGYYRYDRSEKYTGLEEFNGMTLNDLHRTIQVTPDIELSRDASPGEDLEVPVWLSVFTGEIPSGAARLHYFLTWVNETGEQKRGKDQYQEVELKPWKTGYLDPLKIEMPAEKGVAVLNLELQTASNVSLQKNFTVFRIKGASPESEKENVHIVKIKPDGFSDAAWSLKQWQVLDGLKVNGAGHGHFAYEVNLPSGLNAENVGQVVFKAELGSKKILGKDIDAADEMGGDYMRGRGTHDPSRNPNAYPMTDETRFPGLVRIIINDHVIGEVHLKDDPADHRGVLSWHAQLKDRKLREAGSYGYLVEFTLPEHLKTTLLKDNLWEVKIEVPEAMPGGVAIYGADFGRYPLGPMLMFYTR